MNDYKQIRQRYLAGESQRHIAKTMGISRNTVAKYCEGDSVPWDRKTLLENLMSLLMKSLILSNSVLMKTRMFLLKKRNIQQNVSTTV